MTYFQAQIRGIVLMVGLLVCSAAPAASASEQRTFTNAAGTRSYRLHVPEVTQESPAIVVYLHGCKQHAADVEIGTRWSQLADTEGFIVVYPEQPSSANGTRCWNWFQPAHQRRGSGEPSIIAGITELVANEFDADRNRMFVAGASAGGYMTSIMGATYPDLYASIGVLAGGAFNTGIDPTGSFTWSAMGSRARAVPAFIAQGSLDPINPLAMAHGAVLAWVGVADFADDGSANGSVSRAPSQVDHYETQQVPSPRPPVACGIPCPASGLYEDSYPYSVARYLDSQGEEFLNFVVAHGASHNYTGGDTRGSFTDPVGPDLTAATWAFFEGHPLPPAA